MRAYLAAALVSLMACPSAFAAGEFIGLQTRGVQTSDVSGNGRFMVGSDYGSAAFRWTAADGSEESIDAMQNALGINNAGVIVGVVFENGGAYNGGHDLAAYAAIGAAPTLLTAPLASNAIAFDISDDGTVVGRSFEVLLADEDVAFVWTSAGGMSALPVNRPQNASGASAITADGHVVVGWNAQDGGEPTGVVWIDGVPTDIVDADGIAVGEAWGVSDDGRFVVGAGYTDIDGNTGAWRWDTDTGVVMIPDMSFARGVTGDGRTVVGGTDPFETLEIKSRVWREGIGSVLLVDYLAEQDVIVPAGWGFGQGLGSISDDGSVLAGWGVGPLGLQSYIVRILGDAIFEDGFELATH